MTDAEELEMLRLRKRKAMAAAPPSDEGPSELESFGRGALQAGTLGFADEIYGGAKALMGGDYAKSRDESRAAFKRAEEANPGADMAGRLTGAVASAFVPGLGELGAAKTVGGAVLGGAALGAAQGLGESEADLTKGDLAGAARDTVAGGLIGGAAGGVAHGISAGVGKLAGRVAGRAERGAAQAEAERIANAEAKAAKGEASALGKYRSSVQSASRDLEVLGREGAALPGEVGERAAEFVDAPAGRAVREQVAANKLVTAPERIAEMGAAKSAFDDLVARRQEVVNALLEQDTVGKALKPRIATLGHRLIPAALAGAGGYIGGPEGAAVGTGLGATYALLGGRPGVILRNIARSPAARKAAWGMMQRASEVSPQSLGKFGAMLSSALRQGGPKAAEALHALLLEKSPEYGQKVLDTLEPAEGGR